MGAAAAADDDAPRFPTRGAWEEAKAIIGARRDRLALGLLLMVFNRLAGFVLPATSKVLVDDVIGKGRGDLLAPLAFAVGAATVVQAATTFGNAQILGVAAQHAITDMRRRVEAHVVRLPVAYFDSTQAGVLISRIMTDAEGIRNLVGTGLVQLTGSIVTAAVALVMLVWLNWRLTLATSLVLGSFAGMMTLGMNRLRPLFRERGRINADVVGRLNETLGGIRIVKIVHRGAARGAGLHARRPPALPQRRRGDHPHLGDVGVFDDRRRLDRHADAASSAAAPSSPAG